MTVDEITKKYRETCTALSNQYKADLEAHLKELHLDGLVRRKCDGKIGWLLVVNSPICDYSINFYPRLKQGNRSKCSSGWATDIENGFEPFEDDT